MPSTPITGFVKKKVAAKKFKRSARQLTRDITVAMELSDKKILQHLKLRTVDGEVFDGEEVTTDLVNKLHKTEGRNPMWYLRRLWLEESFGHRDDLVDSTEQVTPEEPVVVPPSPSATTLDDEVRQLLREAVTELKGEKQFLKSQLEAKDKQLDEALQRDRESNVLLKNLQELMGNLQEGLLALPAASADERQLLLGIPTGFATLDRLVTMSPGDLTILAARPSMGKTALALGIADHVATAYQKNVLFVSLEMTRQQLLDRILAARVGVETQRLRRAELTAEESDRLGEALDTLDDDCLYIDDDPDRRLVNLRSKARRMQVQHGIDLLVVDYLQLVSVDGPVANENHTRQISYVSNNLKQLARELDCPVLALSQLSRKCEERYDKRPLLSDLRQSGEIEQDADTVLMLYRDSYYDEDCDDPNLTELYVRKNRQGATGVVKLDFEPRTMVFQERAVHSVSK